MTVRLPFDDLVALLAAIFRNGGCSAVVADILAQNMAAAERDGARSHGVFRVAGYLGSLASGWVDGKVEPIVEDVAPGHYRLHYGSQRAGLAPMVLGLVRGLAQRFGQRVEVTLIHAKTRIDEEDVFDLRELP